MEPRYPRSVRRCQSTSVSGSGSLSLTGPFQRPTRWYAPAGGLRHVGLIQLHRQRWWRPLRTERPVDLSEMQSVPVPGVLLLMALGLAVMPTRRWRDQGQSRLSSTPRSRKSPVASPCEANPSRCSEAGEQIEDRYEQRDRGHDVVGFAAADDLLGFEQDQPHISSTNIADTASDSAGNSNSSAAGPATKATSIPTNSMPLRKLKSFRGSPRMPIVPQNQRCSGKRCHHRLWPPGIAR